MCATEVNNENLAMDLETVADELYSLPPSDFTSARDARAAEAKKAADRQLAAAIKSLRRPTVAAWLANQLARTHAEQLEELLQLGPKLRQAQQDLAGADVRALSQDRRRLLSALSGEAQLFADGAQQRVSEATLQELESTLGTGLVDPAAAELLRSGRVVAALTPSDLHDLGFGGGQAAAGGQIESSANKASPRGAGAQPTSADLDKALAGVTAAEAAAKQATAMLASSRAEHDLVVAEIASLEDRLAELRSSADKQQQAIIQAEEACAATERALQAAREHAGRLGPPAHPKAPTHR
jgi:hypothetical protein